MGQDRRFDDVLGVILVRARDIAGDRESGQRGDRDVGRPADAELVHPAAPDGHAARIAMIVHALRLEQAAQAADLDIDDPAGAQVESLAGVVGRVDALVQADRRLRDDCLEPGVVDDVVVGQRLLDQEQAEIVECLERRQVVERVGRVGIDLERDRRETARGPAARRRHPSPARSSA